MPSNYGPRLVVQLGFDPNGPDSRLAGLAHSHPFTHCVQVLLPAPHPADSHAALSASVAKLQDWCSFFHILEGSLAALLAATAQHSSGSGTAPLLRALSLSPAGDSPASGDAVALTSDGTLTLALESSSHQALGVPGRRLPGGVRGQPRYFVTISAGSPAFTPGSASYQRVHQCLQQHAAPQRLLCCACDGQGAAQALQPLPGLRLVATLPVLQQRRRLQRLRLPLLTAQWLLGPGGPGGQPGWWQRTHAAYEWIGGVAAGLGGSDSWPPPQGAETQLGDLEVHSWQGLISPEQVLSLAAIAGEAVTAGAAPWAALLVSGVGAAPIAWWGLDRLPPGPGPVGRRGRGDSSAGWGEDSHYLVLLLPGGATCTFVALGPSDAPAPPGSVQWSSHRPAEQAAAP